MIKVKEKNKEIAYKFPKTSSKNAPFYNLLLISETEIIHNFQGLKNVSEDAQYYEFVITFENVEDGEYKYSIEGYILEYGVIRIGDVTPTIKENKSENKVIQYE